jgi:bifunctional non-homologous end joining protein LigD
VAKAVGKLDLQSVVLDGELVALQSDGVSSFPDLQAALAAGQDQKLNFYAFDLLELEGWDLRACQLLDRKTVLEKLTDWRGLLRFSVRGAKKWAGAKNLLAPTRRDSIQRCGDNPARP